MTRKLVAISFALLVMGLSVCPVAAQADDATVTLRILYDNVPFDPDLHPDWGFSCLVEGMEETILFDTGYSWSILRSNARRLGVDLTGIDAVVFSHVHADHIGGWSALSQLVCPFEVFIPSSFPEDAKRPFALSWIEMREVDGPIEICSDAWSTGELGTDIIEQSLVLRLSGGLVVVTGCAHPGIVEIVDAAHALFPDDPIDLVLGGFHLLQTSADGVRSIGERLMELGVQRIGPTHCTGTASQVILAALFGEAYVRLGVGSVVELSR